MKNSAYISGPMRGLPKFNFDTFDTVARKLRKKTWVAAVFNPAEHDRETFPDIESWEGFDEGKLVGRTFDMHEAMKWDLARVIEADVIVMLPGWEQSSGARHERYVAEVTGKSVYLASYHEYLQSWFFDWDIEQIRVTAKPEKPTMRSRAAQLNESFQYASARRPVSFDISEVRVVDPITGGEKGSKLARYDLLPWDALTELAEHYGRGAAKYEDRNWEKGYAWGLSAASLGRHFASWWQGEDTDAEGFSHAAAMAWHALTLLTFSLRGSGTDDRPVRNVA